MMTRYQFVLMVLLTTIAVSAQKKKTSEEILTPPKKAAYTNAVKAAPSEPLLGDNDAFRWKDEPEKPTTFTPDDLIEKIYRFNGKYSVRIISNYPTETVSYKKPGKNDPENALFGYTMKFEDYDTVEVRGNKILISDKKDPKKERITLDYIKKENKIIRIKEVKTGKVFNKAEYLPSPSA
ncbi:hypothetical protein [Chryseobacterium pennipullorum]|uniref:Beta-lactamase-inhibitor-like PepSY-like domain-containing protein n=1 Tax=Chryseobacterium pennipullorum TaxID=2258963 RepID=A0A3D9B1T1_9FLAO|nr:hypothetical protein [Chryseobacterium pennipullorum]REC47459.1 hypothetical protein DRF67_10460 [Chryseobacterium pennipullorum]